MTVDIPAGFRALPDSSGFVAANGPLYLRHEPAATAGGKPLVLIGFRVEPRHANPMGNCHGGMLATFCDMLLPLSVHRLSPEVGLRFLPTINLQLDYLAPAPGGAWVQGECEVLRVTRTLVFAQGLVTADGTPAVRCSGIFKIGPPFKPAGELIG
ncbi:PaaI family thioesterase [Ideonella sp. A 288]|uniref:PaaI family thioesterase n=1 Tax=Ideonella sp. A 288 TaxID=1962181 RepID=UPI000B4BAE64|nr:PaaI family thioesterase [Ideonella sp. A 288]